MPNWQRGMMRMLRIPQHEVVVTGIHDYSSRYRRITFSCPELLASLEVFPTLWLRLWAEDESKGGELCQRGYTFVDVRPEAGTFALDFVLHTQRGPAGHWAAAARVGERREVALTPRAVRLPAGTERLLLLGDVAALPAINSWIEACGDTVPIDVAIEDDDAADHDLLPCSTGRDVTWSWVAPAPAAPRGTALAAWLRECHRPLPARYAWGAGEKTLVKTLRPVLREHLGLDREHHFTQFYWIEERAFS